jgi:hypothetical protein
VRAGRGPRTAPARHPSAGVRGPSVFRHSTSTPVLILISQSCIVTRIVQLAFPQHASTENSSKSHRIIPASAATKAFDRASTHKLNNYLSNNKIFSNHIKYRMFTMESNTNDIQPELINKGMLNQLNHEDIEECKEGDEEISFPKAFAFLEDESHSKYNYCAEWLEPFSSTTHNEQFEETSSLPYEVHQSSICEENNKTEASYILSSPSSVTSHHLYNNPYLHILNMKEAFKGFKFLLPIMRTEFKSHIANHEPSQHDLKIAKQRIASVVLFHGGNLERSKANIGSRQGKIRPQRKPSKLFPRLKATVSTYPLSLVCDTYESTENFKILLESSIDTAITTEAATGVDEKITETKSAEFQNVGKCIKGSSAVVEKVKKGTLDDDNDAIKYVEGFAKKWAIDETMIKDPDPDDIIRKRSLDEVEASVTDKLSSCVSSSNGTEQDGILHKKKKTKTTYHCKLCGLPKQKHKCIHLQYLERSIGVMVSYFFPLLNSL